MSEVTSGRYPYNEVKKVLNIREHHKSFSNREFAYAVAGQLYAQAPGHKPRKADIIMEKVLAYIEEHNTSKLERRDWIWVGLTEDKVYGFVKTMLFSIPEIQELNLSEIEFEKGVKVDDPNRKQYKFTSMYDVEDKSSTRMDFIDLDAFVGNVVYGLFKNQMPDSCFSTCIDCEFLKYGEKIKSEECSLCKHNQEYTDKLKRRIPRKRDGKNFVCTAVCAASYDICCTECKSYSDCEFKCLADPKFCGKSHDYSNVEDK